MNKKSNKMRSTGAGILVLLMLASGFISTETASAQGKTDFSGTWSLNESKSTLGEARFRMSMPSMIVVQEGNSMEVTRTMVGRNGQERKMTETYSLDGKESTNENFNGNRKSTCSWSADGKTLTIASTLKTERNGQVFENKSKDTWTLSGDGRTLSIESHSSNQRGERTMTLVYDKK